MGWTIEAASCWSNMSKSKLKRPLYFIDKKKVFLKSLLSIRLWSKQSINNQKVIKKSIEIDKYWSFLGFCEQKKYSIVVQDGFPVNFFLFREIPLDLEQSVWYNSFHHQTSKYHIGFWMQAGPIDYPMPHFAKILLLLNELE